MVIYQMPFQRRKYPGRNSQWLNEMSRTEKGIIRSNHYTFCGTSIENYLRQLNEEERSKKPPSSTRKVTFATTQETEIEDKTSTESATKIAAHIDSAKDSNIEETAKMSLVS